MSRDLVLSARIESIIWEALAENDLQILVLERFAAELVALVRDQQAEAWDEGFAEGVGESFSYTAPNPYRQEQEHQST